MTFDELKAEAEKQGYNLVKKPEPMPKMQPCLCGRKQIHIWHKSNPDEYQANCPKCGFGKDSEWASSTRRAREIWNERIENKRYINKALDYLVKGE